MSFGMRATCHYFPAQILESLKRWRDFNHYFPASIVEGCKDMEHITIIVCPPEVGYVSRSNQHQHHQHQHQRQQRIAFRRNLILEKFGRERSTRRCLMEKFSVERATIRCFVQFRV